MLPTQWRSLIGNSNLNVYLTSNQYTGEGGEGEGKERGDGGKGVEGGGKRGREKGGGGSGIY